MARTGQLYPHGRLPELRNRAGQTHQFNGESLPTGIGIQKPVAVDARPWSYTGGLAPRPFHNETGLGRSAKAGRSRRNFWPCIESDVNLPNSFPSRQRPVRWSEKESSIFLVKFVPSLIGLWDVSKSRLSCRPFGAPHFGHTGRVHHSRGKIRFARQKLSLYDLSKDGQR